MYGVSVIYEHGILGYVSKHVNADLISIDYPAYLA